MATELTGRAGPTPPISQSRPRWVTLVRLNLLLVVSLAIWAGAILMIVG
jgi:hypothetical protein